MRTRWLGFVLVLGIAGTSWGADDAGKPHKIEASKLGKTRNVHTCGNLFLAGQPTPEDIAVLKKKGIQRVITLRTDGEIDWDEAARVQQAGIEFVQVPFRLPDSLTDKVFDEVRRLLREHDRKPTLLHCGSANRVGAVWLAYRVLDEKVPLKQAIEEARKVGLRSPAYLEKAVDYIERHQK